MAAADTTSDSNSGTITAAVFLLLIGLAYCPQAWQTLGQMSFLVVVVAVSTLTTFLCAAIIVGAFVPWSRQTIWTLTPQVAENLSRGNTKPQTSFEAKLLTVALVFSLPLIYVGLDRFLRLSDVPWWGGGFLMLCVLATLYALAVPMYWSLIAPLELWFAYVSWNWGPEFASAVHLLVGIGFGGWLLLFRLRVVHGIALRPV